MKRERSLGGYFGSLLLLLAVVAMGCEISQTNIVVSPSDGAGNHIDTTTQVVSITVVSAADTIKTGETVEFFATVTGSVNTGVAWSVISGPGAIDSNGI